MAFLILIFSTVIFGCLFQPKIVELDSKELVEIKEEFPKDGFGYASDIGELERNQVRANQSLYVLLNEMGFSQQEIHQVSKKLKQNVGFRFLKQNQIYYRYRKHHSTTPVSYAPILILMESNVRYIKIDLSDGIVVEASAKPIEIRYRQVDGIIESSLYESLVSRHSAGVGMELATLHGRLIFFACIEEISIELSMKSFIRGGSGRVGRVLPLSLFIKADPLKLSIMRTKSNKAIMMRRVMECRKPYQSTIYLQPAN